MKNLNFRQAFVIGVIISAMTILYGCGDSGGDGSPVVHNGTFVDSHIEGIDYFTPTYSGTTDYLGTFQYQPGETVSFYVGGVYLGSAQGEGIITIVDLVDGATDIYHPVVTNIARFLQSLDEDENPDNGINIALSTINSLQQRDIDIIDPDLDFDNNIEIQNLLSEIGNIPVTAFEAQQHFLQFLSGEAESECDDFPGLIGSWKWTEEYDYSPIISWEKRHTWDEHLTLSPNCTFTASQCTRESCNSFYEGTSNILECTCTKIEIISGNYATTPDSVTIGNISYRDMEFTDQGRYIILVKGNTENFREDEIVYERQ